MESILPETVGATKVAGNSVSDPYTSKYESRTSFLMTNKFEQKFAKIDSSDQKTKQSSSLVSTLYEGFPGS